MAEKLLKEIADRLQKSRVKNSKGKFFFPADLVGKAMQEIVDHYEKKYEGATIITKEQRMAGAYQTKLTEDEQMEIYFRKLSGNSVSRLAREYGVSRGTILNYCEKMEKKYDRLNNINVQAEIEKSRKRFKDSLTEPELRQNAILRYELGETINDLAKSLEIEARVLRIEIGKEHGKKIFCKTCGKENLHVENEHLSKKFACATCGTIAQNSDSQNYLISGNIEDET